MWVALGCSLCFDSQCQMCKLSPIAASALRLLLQVHVDFLLTATSQRELGPRPPLVPFARAGAVALYKPG